MTDPDPFPEPNGDRAPGHDAARTPTHDANDAPNGDRDHDPPRGRDTLGDGDRAAGFDETSVDPADIASAGRSCSAIVILLVVLALLVCVGVTARWFVLQ